MDQFYDSLISAIERSDKNKINEIGTIDEIANKLNTSIESGLTNNSIQTNRNKFGLNVLPEKEIKSFGSLLIEALSDQTLIILIGCAIFSLVFETLFASEEEKSKAWIDGAAILIAVVIVSIVQSISNYKQELQFASMNHIKSIFNVNVIRNNEETIIKNTEVVVGDIVCLESGDRIPADGLLIYCDKMKVNQSVTSGESEAVCKDIENDIFVHSGNLVEEGRGRFLVICIGENSLSGKMFSLIEDEQKQTPLQERLEVLATNIGYAGMIVAGLTFISLFIYWLISRIHQGFTWKSCEDIISYLINSITIIVVAVPEGLPLAVTISLAYSMRKMMYDNNFVRQLYACETMGNATVICTDKTGTLTMNKMNVERIIIGDSDIKIDELKEKTQVQFRDLLMDSISLNTTGIICNDGSEIGSQTEIAILRLVKDLGGKIEKIRKEKEIEKINYFDRDRKIMSTIVKSDNEYISYIKGASEYVIEKCNSYVDCNGNVLEMNNNFRENIEKLNCLYCDKAYRLLAICYKKLDKVPNDVSESETKMTLICIVAIRDSLRPSTVEAIQECQSAGINVIMITGDSVNTANAIAKECGISLRGICTTGEELRKMNEKQLCKAISNVSVVARSTPMDKQIIVSALQKNGEIVAVTGDGTNDVAALMKADVGLSMGKCGTELAKEASDIVILDDDFKSIVRSVLWGRCIFNNVRKFLQFQLTANIVTLFISIISALFLNDTPFKAVQLLWINLIMDSLGALALATGNPNSSLLKRPPTKRSESLVSGFMIKNITGQCIYQIVVIFTLLLIHGNIKAHSRHHYTFLFNVFVYCQAFNLLNARVVNKNDSLISGVLDSKLFLIIMFGIIIFEFILVQFFSDFFASVPLSMKEHIIGLVIGFGCTQFGCLFRSMQFKLANKFVSKIHKIFTSTKIE